jgi:hypothetical protein
VTLDFSGPVKSIVYVNMDAHGDYVWEMNKDPEHTVSNGYDDDGSLKLHEVNKHQTLHI